MLTPQSGMTSMLKNMLGIDPEQIRAEMAKFVTDTSSVLHGYDDKLKHLMLRLDSIDTTLESIRCDQERILNLIEQARAKEAA